MLDDVLIYLRCPICGAGLDRSGGSLRCATGHCFDIARQGYVNLLGPGVARNSGDTAAMVQARQSFLLAGHFGWLAAKLASAAAASLRRGRPETAELADRTGLVVDIGAGTGYYLAAVLDRLPGHAGLALDISKYALRVAARAHRRSAAAGCDAWQPLPLADQAADLVLNVFAPRDGAELHRVLHPAGSLLVVTPTSAHLSELIGPLGLLTVDERKQERLTRRLGPQFELVSERVHGRTVELGHAAVAALTAMGPSSWHVDPDALAERIELLPDPLPVTLAVTLSVLRPRAQPLT